MFGESSVSTKYSVYMGYSNVYLTDLNHGSLWPLVNRRHYNSNPSML